MILDMHVLKIDYKRQTTVLSVIFVLVGMIFLVPAITGKAEAIIRATVLLHGQAAKLTWTLLAAEMIHGAFTERPTQKGDQIAWTTHGFIIPPFGGDELGFVKYSTAAGDVTFLFSNPFTGKNTCKITVENPALHGDCKITQGPTASAFYNVFSNSFANGGNGGGDEGGGGGHEGGGGDEGEGSGVDESGGGGYEGGGY
jgi:uncharacterized membrane protein YgcG